MAGVDKDKNHKAIIVLSIGVICFVLPTISAAVLGLTSPPGPTNKCGTDDCRVGRLEAAASILKYRDDKTAPCDNFFQHVCGNYKESDLTQDYDFIEDARKVVKNDMIGEKMAWTDESPVYKLVHDFYTVCMDGDSSGDKAWELLQIKVRALGGWPAVARHDWKEDDFDWMDFIGDAKKEGFDINFFVDWVPKKKKNGDQLILVHDLEMASSYFDDSMNPEEKVHRKLYKDLMGEMAYELGAPNSDVHSDLDAAAEFEFALYRVMRNTDASPKNMTIEEIQKEFPSVDWAKFVEKTLTPFLDSNDQPELAVSSPAALTEFLDLLAKTPKRVQATYAMWKVVQFMVPLIDGIYTTSFDKYNDIIGYPKMPREAYCDKMTTKYADLAVERYYLEHFDSSIETIGKMFSVIKKKMIEMIKESKTLSEDEKKEGVEIMQGMEHTIGPSEKLSDLHELEKFYADAKITFDNFVQTVLDMSKFKIKKMNSEELRKETFKFDPQKLVLAGTPENFQNHLYVPTSMIRNLMFDNNQPMYMNFGAAGSLMAAAMIKSVAHLGKKKADDGTVIPNNQYKCFTRIADNITLPLLKEAFQKVLVDEFVDGYIGIVAAYQAYQQYVAESGPELPLPEVPYTVQQLFWIAFVRDVCSANVDGILPKPSEDLDLDFVDYMLMMLLKNVPEISADFNCPVGSLMNPENKCSWW